MAVAADRTWTAASARALLSLAAALAVSAGVAALAGAPPGQALWVLLTGACGDGEAIGYTLFYATDFLLTGLAVAVAFQAGLFNVGAEGQMTLGGITATLAALACDGLPWPVVMFAAGAAAMAGGAVWGFLPGWLQARRGSHIVVTTILFNFIAAGVATWLLVEVLAQPGQAAPESRSFAAESRLPGLDAWAGALGWAVPESPVNPMLPVALLCCGLYGLALRHSRWGYETRVVGQNPAAAIHGGIAPGRVVIGAMLIAGALAGLAAVNPVLGAHHRLVLGFAGGAGFVGIAVAMMGRCHPAGMALAALLFGALTQGGSELAFEVPGLDRDLVVVIQGLVVLFAGAIAPVFQVERWWAAVRRVRAGHGDKAANDG